jgi:hypothetical protein
MTANRGALLFVGAVLSLGAVDCSSAHTSAPPGHPSSPEASLAVDPLPELVPAAGLSWLVDLRPTEILGDPYLGPAIGLLLPASAFDAFERRHGGVDLRHAGEVTVAGFADVTLALARLAVDPPRIESAFADRAAAVDGRAVEHGITRLWGTVGEEREQIAIFGHQAVGLERGRFGPLRVATYYAEGRLKRSPTALRADPLRSAADRLGDCPARAFAPGPFEGSWADGLAGLLRGATAVGTSLRPVRLPGGGFGVKLTVVVLGGWGEDGPAAAQRLGAAFNVLAEDPLGRLAELNRPLEGPHVVGDATEARLEVILDATALARGIRDATSAQVADIVASPRRAP